MYIYTHMCEKIYTYTHWPPFIYTCMCIYVCTYMCMQTHICVYIHNWRQCCDASCVYVHIYVFRYSCMCIYSHISTPPNPSYALQATLFICLLVCMYPQCFSPHKAVLRLPSFLPTSFQSPHLDLPLIIL